MKLAAMTIGLGLLFALQGSCSGSGGSGGAGPGATADDTGDSLGEGEGAGEGEGNGHQETQDTFDECAAVSQTAGNVYQPADVIFAIDNSPSMGDEIEEVRANMYSFAKSVADKGLDMHVVLISCRPGDCDKDQFLGICIDPPFGAGTGCPADDSHLPNYLHLSTRVPSTKGLRWIVENYSDYQQMLRDDATRHVVVISDDGDEWTSSQFDSALRALDPGFKDYLFHGIFSSMSKEDGCAASHACCNYAAPDGEGTAYRELAELTGGVSGDLCEQDFDPVFEALASSVIGHAKLSCAWTIPAPPVGETLDPNKVNVALTDASGDEHLLGHVDAVADCAAVEHGWYYNDAVNPSAVLVCPQTCAWIQGLVEAKIEIFFGCETEDAVAI